MSDKAAKDATVPNGYGGETIFLCSFSRFSSAPCLPIIYERLCEQKLDAALQSKASRRRVDTTAIISYSHIGRCLKSVAYSVNRRE